MDKLEQARRQINEIDREMAALFERRMHAARQIAEYKKEHGLPIYNAERENEVIARNAGLIGDPGIRSFYVRFLQDEMAVSKQYQERVISGARIAYSGIEGAFADIAAKKIFPHAKTVAYPDFKAAYDAVENGECDCCVLPVENSYAGEVGAVMDLMFSGSLYVNGIYTLRVAQHLLGIPGASINGVKTVVSHPQALSQCAVYIRKKGYKTEKATNTALAAKAVKEAGDPTRAAIASRETAHLYGLEVLDHDINESAVNSTRFAVFSRVGNDRIPGGDGTFLLMFTVKNEAGALAQALNVIGSYGYNMRALRSRPMKDLPWQYYFYIEAEGDETGENGEQMLRHVSLHCDRLKVVGHFGEEIILKDEG